MNPITKLKINQNVQTKTVLVRPVQPTEKKKKTESRSSFAKGWGEKINYDVEKYQKADPVSIKRGQN